MDQDIYKALRAFNSVWQRVGGGSGDASSSCAAEPERTDGPDGDARQLREFMDAEYMSASFYTALASRVSGRQRALLLQAACDEKKHLRRLQLEYYLLTGETWSAPRYENDRSGVLSQLRTAYLTEMKTADGYRSAARQTENAELAALWTEIASDEDRHAAAARQMTAAALR